MSTKLPAIGPGRTVQISSGNTTTRLLGKSNFYTIGFIGEHKVVSTKLPVVGPGRTAQISSGNTTTRLLGKYTQTV